MANPSYVYSLLPGPLKSLDAVFRYVLGALRFGSGAASTKAENFALYAIEGTTPATPDTEFSIRHGRGKAPTILIPYLPLDTVGAQVVPLTVTRAADAERIYLSSSVASATMRVYIET